MNQEVVQKRLKILEQLQEELNKLKTGLEEALMDDPNYAQMVEEEEEAKKVRKEKKEKIMNTAIVKGYQEEIKEKMQEIRENKELLAQELIDYYKENGTLEITDPDGNVKRMKFSVRLVS